MQFGIFFKLWALTLLGVKGLMKPDQGGFSFASRRQLENNLAHLSLTKDTWLTAWACVLEADLRRRDDNNDDTCHTVPTDVDSQLFYKSHT